MSKRKRDEDEESLSLSDMKVEDAPKKRLRKLSKKEEVSPSSSSSPAPSDDEEEEDSMADFIASEDEEEASDAFDDAEMAALAAQLGDDTYSRMMQQSKRALLKEKAERKRYVANTSHKQRWQDQVQSRLEERRLKLLKRSATDPRLRERIERADAKRRALYGGEDKHHPLGLISDLFFHQMSALGWLLLRQQLPYKESLGAMLSDDMGLGKTLVTLTMIAFSNIMGYKRSRTADLRHVTPVHLIVAPNNLLANWIKEAQTHFEPHAMQLIVCHDTYTPKWQTSVTAEMLSEANAVIINYEGLRAVRKRLVFELASHMIEHLELYVAAFQDLEIDLTGGEDGQALPTLDRETAERYADEYLEIGYAVLWTDPERWSPAAHIYGWHWAGVVLDESGTAKNNATQIFKSVIGLKYASLVTLSGTPVENSLDELYNMFRLLGIDKGARSIANKKKWNRLVRAPEDGRALAIPSDEIVAKLRRRFLNVLQLRREIHNVNGVNPLAEYVKRMQHEVAPLYEEFVTVRTSQKSERSYNRTRPSSSVHDQEPEERDHWDQTLDALVRQSIDGERYEEMSEHIAEGFYWYTPQDEFERAFKLVDGWMTEALGVSLYDLHAAHEAARNEMRRLRIRQPEETAHIDAIVEAIEGTLKGRRAHLPAGDPRARTIKVLSGFPVPKPHLFVARPHPLELDVYRQMIKWTAGIKPSAPRLGSSSSSAEEDKTTQTTSAFVCIARARACCGDYRTGGGAIEYLDKARGTLYDVNRKEGAMEALHAPAEEEDEPTATTKKSSGSEAPEALLKKKAALGALDPDDFLLADKILQERELKKNGLVPAAVGESKKRPWFVPTRIPTKYLMLWRYIRAVRSDPKSKNDKMVIMTDLIQCFPYLSQFLTQRGVSNVVVTGAMPMIERVKALERFNNASDPHSPSILIGSLKILNSGHNLQVANHLIVWRPWWSSAIEEQAKRRILRPGQLKEVHFVYFVLLGTIEELVLARSGMKTTLIDRVVGFDDGVIKTGANYSRPLAEEARLMEFTADEWGGWQETDEAHQEKSIGELLERLPRGGFVGQSFKSVDASDIISADGKMKPVNIARAINAAGRIVSSATPSSPPRAVENEFVFSGLDEI